MLAHDRLLDTVENFILFDESKAGKTRKDYGFTGREVVDIPGLSGNLKPRQQMEAIVHRSDGSSFKLPLYLMILTADEVAYYKNGGILPYVLRNLLAA